MKCERCGIKAEGYELHDYCEVCSRNLCAVCLEAGRCRGGKKHVPSNHGEPKEPA